MKGKFIMNEAFRNEDFRTRSSYEARQRRTLVLMSQVHRKSKTWIDPVKIRNSKNRPVKGAICSNISCEF
ncbi:MAG: hypothetical protein C5B49_01170 [Bdellovibrio sp.]|nr:MAG: hypothetical protein C5B49_01170 [Bdellovibrio sp.]